MRLKKISVTTALLICICTAITGCGEQSPSGAGVTDAQSGATLSDIPSADGSSDEISAPVDRVEFSDASVQSGNTSDADISDGDTTIVLNGAGADINGGGASVEGSVVTITSQGSYVISGSLENGQIRVDTSDEEKVKLYFNGVDITCADSSALWIISAPKKVVISLVSGSVNKLADGNTYSDTSDDAPSAALYSKEDLKIDGDGTLYVTGNYNKGIVSKDDLEICGGIIYVTAVDDAVRGKDSVSVTGGTMFLYAGGDGIRTSNEEDADKGNILIEDGYIEIESELDGIQAVNNLSVTGGTIKIKSGGGSANASTGDTANEWGSWGGDRHGMPGRPGGQTEPAQTDSGDSAKGIKGGGTVTISGGTISIDSSDDCLHSNTTVIISDGTVFASGGDDGIHADTRLEISGGSISIEKSYEGIESSDIVINGGEIRITASDDGINAAGGNDSSALGGRPGQGGFSESTGKITITGGYVSVNASGDGIDSNGSVTMAGGIAVVYGPTNNGNGALDYNDSFTVTGGTLLAVGSAGMAQSVTASGQKVIATQMNVPADTIIDLRDSEGNDVLTFKAPKSFQTLVFTSPSLKSGTYTVYTGGSYSVEPTDGIYTGGSYTIGDKKGEIKA